MICELCGEVAETFITEGHGELCEACQKEVQQDSQQTRPPNQAGSGRELSAASIR